MNLALGAKILWRIVTGKRTWWKEILQKNYMIGDRKRCIEAIDQSRKGTHVLELCKKVTYIIHDQIYWILGSAKQVKIWDDNIGPTSHVNFTQELAELMRWMEQANARTLYDLSKWMSRGRWDG